MSMDLMNALPANYQVRSPRQEDLKAVSQLLETCAIEDSGAIEITEGDVQSLWNMPGFNLEIDAWMVLTPTGELAGYADVESIGQIKHVAMIRVPQAYRGLGISTSLLHLTEERTRQKVALAPEGVAVCMICVAGSQNPAASVVLERAGFEVVRHAWTMEIEMTEPPQAPSWPEGLQLRSFVSGQDERAVYDCVEETFSDHWGHIPQPYDTWAHWTYKREGFDPSLWFLAYAGTELAACALCAHELAGQLGWVADLGVRRPWRRQGLGMALLQQAFGEFYRRGTPKVGLGVDTQNLTGATRLYERAGMHVVRQQDTYQKELRAGIDPSTQTVIL